MKFILLLLLCSLLSSHATWYKMKVEPGSDILMGEVQWPKWSPSTYYTLWNSNPVDGGGYFYGGFTSNAHGKEQSDPNYKPQITWSFWRGDAYKGKPMVPLWFADDVMGLRMDFEGAILGFTGSTDFVDCNVWYRALIRTWKSETNPEETGYIGWWMKNMKTGEWYCLGVAELPMNVKGLGGNSGFVEELGYGKTQRRLKRKNWYYHQHEKQQWSPSDSITTEGNLAKNWFILNKDKSEVALNMVGELEKAIPADGKRTEYKLKQSPQPKIGKIIKPRFSVKSMGKTLAIRWTNDVKSTPQLGFAIELFDNSSAEGAPMVTHTSVLSYLREEGLRAEKEIKAVKFTYTDVYNQKQTWLLKPTPASEISASAARDEELSPGIQFNYIEYPEDSSGDDLLAVFNRYPVTTKGLCNSISPQVIKNKRMSHYGIGYDGFYKALEDNVYTFEVVASDGCEVRIGDTLCFKRNRARTPAPERFSVFLKKGYHRIEFKHSRLVNTTYSRDWKIDRLLWLGVKTPGKEMKELSRENLFTSSSNTPGSITLKSLPQLESGKIPLEISYLPQQNISRVELFYQGTLYQSFSQDQLPKDGSKVRLEVLVPEGERVLKARAWMGEHTMIESQVIAVNATNQVDPFWTNATMKNYVTDYGLIAHKDSVAAVSKTPFFIYRKLDGDFSITGKLTEFDALHSGYLGKFGLYVSPKPYLSHSNYSISKNGDGTFRGFSDDRDLAGEGRSRYSYGKDAKWMKIVRRGNWLRTYLSVDGKTWRKVAEEFPRWAMVETLYVGVFSDTNKISSIPLLRGKIEELKISPLEKAPQLLKQLPLDKKLTEVTQGINSIIPSQSQKNTFYARSSSDGLLVSKDSGDSWSPLNANLAETREAKCLRSIAVHPTNPNIILRGGGYSDGKTRKSGLWRSEDAGKSWQLVQQEIDFDGTSPTALMGETISFSVHNPKLVIAAGETSGVYLSEDAGKTWQYRGLKGQRISCLKFNERLEHQIEIGTCPQSALTQLNLPTAVGEAEASIGKLYRTYLANLAHAKPVASKPNWGICDLRYECFPEAGTFLYVATTDGFYYSFNKENLHQRRELLKADLPYFALAEAPSIRKRSAILTVPFTAFEGSPTVSIKQGRISTWWQPIWHGVAPGVDVPREMISQGIRSIAIVNHSKPIQFKEYLIATSEGIFKTKDEGGTFKKCEILKTPSGN